MKIRTSLAVASCAAFITYGEIFTAEPAHSAVAVPVGAVFTAVLIACEVIRDGRRARRTRRREDADRAAARALLPSGPYRAPPREWAALCDAKERLEWVRELHARGIHSAEEVSWVEVEVADAQRAWRRAKGRR